MSFLLFLDTKDSGISGDIFLSALLQLSDNSASILRDLQQLKDYLPGVSLLNIKLDKIKRNELNVGRLNIQIKENKTHRSVKQLKNSLKKYLIDKTYSDEAIRYANSVLDTLIRAEAEIHEDLPDKVHLHELSSIDTLIDILGVAKVLDEIGYFSRNCRLYLNELPLGGGKIKTAHGILPVPAPATMKIIEKSTIPVKLGPIDSEITTPTGAALLYNLNIEQNTPPMIVKKVIYSTGEKQFEDFLNIMKLYHGEIASLEDSIIRENYKQYQQEIALLETNIDDVTGEEIGNFIEIMENEKILDIQIIQGLTKKNRPSHEIKILCHPKEAFNAIMKTLEELGTLGVRFSIIDRFCVNREIKTSQIKILGTTYSFSYKLSYLDLQGERKIINVKPEYEDLKKISIQSKMPFKKLDLLAKGKINEELNHKKLLK